MKTQFDTTRTESWEFIERVTKLSKQPRFDIPVTPIPSKKSSLVVYRIYDKSETRIYIGYTNNLRYRLIKLRAKKSWGQEMHHVIITEHADRKEARFIARELIKQKKPRYNA